MLSHPTIASAGNRSRDSSSLSSRKLGAQLNLRGGQELRWTLGLGVFWPQRQVVCLRMCSEVRWIRVVLLSPETHRTKVNTKSHCKEQRAYDDVASLGGSVVSSGAVPNQVRETMRVKYPIICTISRLFNSISASMQMCKEL